MARTVNISPHSKVYKRNPRKRQRGTMTFTRKKIRIQDRETGTSRRVARHPWGKEDTRKARRQMRKLGYRVNPLPAALKVLKAAEAAFYRKNPPRVPVNDKGTYKLQERRGSGWHTVCTMTDMTRDACVKVAKQYHKRHPGKKLRLFF